MDSLEWAAGLYEGEGSFASYQSKANGGRKNGWRYQLQMSMTDEDVIRRFASVVEAHVEGGRVNGPYQYAGNRKPFWQFTLTGHKALRFATLLFPLLGTRRREQVLEAQERKAAA